MVPNLTNKVHLNIKASSLENFENTENGDYPMEPGKSMYDGWPLVEDTIPIDESKYDEMGELIKLRETPIKDIAID